MLIQSGNTGRKPVIEALEPRLLLTVWPAMDWFEIDGDRWLTYGNTVTVGGDREVDIKTGWSNSCLDDGPGGVTMSFPGFPYLSSLGISSSDVSWTSDNGQGARTEILKQAGDVISTTWGQQAASHVLVEAGDTDWDGADGGGIYESQILEVTIHTPSTTQDIRVHVRGYIQDTDASWTRNPYTLSPDGDQQGWPVYYFTIKVDADGPNAPGTPYMYPSDDSGYRDDDGITSDRSPRFGWNQPSDPGGSGVVQYHWEIRTAEGSFVDDGYGASLEGQPDGDLGDGHYKIRVQAADAVGNWGSWSSYLPFTIDGTEPSSPQPPVPSGDTATLTPLIQWSYNSSYDWKYDVDLEYQGLLAQWYDVGGWPKVAERTGVIQASPLTWDMNYRVAVRQYDIAGNRGVYSAYTYFNTVDPNHAPTDISLSSNSVAENEPSGTAVGTLSTADPDTGNTFTYTLVGGAGSDDNGSFAISGATLTTAASFDYESKNTYSIRVRSMDQGGLFTEKAFAISVTNVNETPTDISLSSNSVAENEPSGVAVGTFGTADPDSSDTFTYTLVGGTGDADNGSFAISGDTLTTAASFDYESKNTYSIRVRSTDQDGLFTEKAFAISVTNVNEPPAINDATFTIAEDSANGTVVGMVVGSDPDVGQTLTYAITAGNTGGAFAIDAISGQITVADSSALDYGTTPSFGLTVEASDNGIPSLSAFATVTVNLTDANETPTDISLSSNSVAENEPSGTAVGTFGTADPDTADTFTYSLVGGTGDADNGSFAITGDTLTTAASFDYESKNTYSIRVRSMDQDGLFTEKAFAISVTNANETPAISNATFTIAEDSVNGTVVGTVIGSDPDTGQSLTYAIAAGNTGGAFAIDGISGQITVADNSALDYGTTPSFGLTVEASDNGIPSLSGFATVTVNLTDANEAPTDISLSSNSVAENEPSGTAVGTFGTADADSSDTFTYTLVGGTGSDDNGSFAITGDTLTTAGPFDYESKNTYSIRVRSMDQDGLFTEKAFAISVTNVNELPAVALANTTATLGEDTDTGSRIKMADIVVMDDALGANALSLSGPDASLFEIYGTELYLKAGTTLDYATNPQLDVTVEVDDAAVGAAPDDTADLSIAVTDENEPPIDIAFSNNTVAENEPAGTVVGTLSTTDPDTGNTFTYTLVGGAGSDDNGSFAITGDALITAASFDYESKNTYSIRVRSMDQDGLFTEKVFAISVADANETPTDISLSSNSVAENEPSGTAVGTFGTADADSSDTFTYTLVGGTGSDDNGSFAITGDTLTTAGPFDYESKNTYSIRVRSTDQDGLFTEKAFAINITDANEPPAVALANTTATLAEDTDTGSPIKMADIVVMDDALGANALSLSGPDASLFEIYGTELYLKAGTTLDYATNPQLDVTVEVDDATVGAAPDDTADLSIVVTDENEPPIDIAFSNNTVAENEPAGTVVGTLSTADPDSSDTFTYTLVGGTGDADNGSFAITGDTLTTAASFDYESKNTYSIRVRSTDQGGLFTEKAFAINITDANETPTDISLSSNSVAENEPSGTAVGTFGTADPDTADTFTYTLVGGAGDADNGSFAITGDALTTAASFDYESKNSYSIRVRSTDQDGLFTEKVFAINITDANETPAISNATFTIAEDSVNGTVVGMVVGSDPDAGQSLTYAITAGNTGGAFAIDAISGEITVADSSALDYGTTPSFGLTVEASDNGIPSLSQTATITVDLVNVNEPPVPGDLWKSTDEDVAVDGIVTATDGDDDPLTFFVVDGPVHGAVGMQVGGSFTYTPAGDFSGSDSFTFKANDGTADSASATVSITVAPVNDAPEAHIQSVATDEDTIKLITLTGSDIETPAGQLVYSIATAPQHGTVSISGNQATYTPTGDYNGPDSFAFVATDTGDPAGSHDNPGDLSSNPATVSITIDPVNDRPAGSDDDYAEAVDNHIDIVLHGTDIETDYADLIFAIISAPAQGTLTATGQGQYRYDPNPGHAGQDSFTYTVTDTGDPVGTPGNVLTSPQYTVSLMNGYLVDLDAKGRWEGYDADGDWVRITLKGPGTGTLLFPQNGYCDPIWLRLRDTTDKSSLSIITRGRHAETTIRDIIVNGSLRSLMAKTTDLLGDITVNGSLGMLVMDDVADGHLIDIGAGLTAQDISRRDRVKLTFDRVADTTVNTHLLPISCLTATEWLDTDGIANDAVISYWALNIKIKGDRRRSISGDFEADVTLAGQDKRGMSLNNLQVAGKIVDSQINLAGAAGTIMAAQWDTGSLNAAWVKNVMTKGNRRKHAMAGDFGANLTLTGQDKRGMSLNKLQVAGTIVGSQINLAAGGGTIMAAQWDTGSLNAAWIKNIMTKRNRHAHGIAGDMGAELTVAMNVNRVFVAGDLSGVWNIGSVNTVTVKGSLIDAQLWLSQGPDNKLKALGRLSVSKWIDNSDIHSMGNIGSVTAAAMRNSSIFAGTFDWEDNQGAGGLSDGVPDLPEAFEVANEWNAAWIQCLTITGKLNSPAGFSLINSNIAASELKRVSICYASLANDGVPFGLSADAIHTLSHKDAGGTTVWTNLSDAVDSFEIQDLKVQLA